MIVAADFIRSAKARDSELTTTNCKSDLTLSFGHTLIAHTSCPLSDLADRPLIIQFAAKDAQTLATAASLVAPFSDGVDLNCGCPQRYP